MEDVRLKAIDFAVANGLMVRVAAPENEVVISHAPFALFPANFPEHLYELAVKIQPIFNQLVDIISKDSEFIFAELKETAEVDDFIKGCLEIYEKILKEPSKQTLRLGIHRSDYLLHLEEQEGYQIKQVELNTISSSFSSLSTKVSELHRSLSVDAVYKGLQNAIGHIPRSSSIEDVPDGIAEAWKAYGSPKAIVVMLVQPNERNMYDQRLIEMRLLASGIRLRRVVLKDFVVHGREQDEVAIVYYRAGYTPTDYTGQDVRIEAKTNVNAAGQEWSARLLIEKSFAIKCPPISYHLVGSKKIQQVLALPGVLERFIKDPNDAKLLRSSFTGLYPLDSSEVGLKAVQDAIANPQRYVLKPQREGGGNNVYGDQIKELLLKLSDKEKKAYILMDLISSPSTKCVMIRRGQPIELDAISELGIYGVWLSNDKSVLINKSAGHLLRTKPADSNEGGVAAGFAVLNSPLLSK
ncbi:Glutathione synthetase [Phlyctochytrium planicorne]|nr:Glutathione synthetase [Phlyctochytrium planicorne]